MKNYVKTLSIDGKEYSFFVTFKDVKRINMRFSDNTFRVSAPIGMPTEKIDNFLAKSTAWIKRVAGKHEIWNEKSNKIMYLGKEYDLEIVQGRRDMKIVGDRFVVYCPSGSREEAKKVFIRFWTKMCKDYFVPRTEEAYRKFGKFLHVPKMPEICFVYVKSYWGQCSSKHCRIKYNISLLQCDERYCEYVVRHELTHFLYMDHSPNFHAALEQIYPGAAKIRKLRSKYNIEMWFDQ